MHQTVVFLWSYVLKTQHRLLRSQVLVEQTVIAILVLTTRFLLEQWL